MQTSNSGNWALITGASSGLGVEFAHILAARRMNLVLAARGVADMERLAEALRSAHGIDVIVEGIDLSQPGAAAELKKQKLNAFPIRPIVTDQIEYLPADEEEEHVVAQANHGTVRVRRRIRSGWERRVGIVPEFAT